MSRDPAAIKFSVGTKRTDGGENTKPLTLTITLGVLARWVRTRYSWAEKAQKYRANPEQVNKDLLGFYTPGGIFDKRRHTDFHQVHSGLVYLDVDNAADPERTRLRLSGVPGCVLTYLSLSGTGVHGLFAVTPVPANADDHRAAWETVAAKVAGVTKLPVGGPEGTPRIDTAGKDLARMVYPSSDPDARYQPRHLDTPVSWQRQESDRARRAGEQQQGWEPQTIGTLLDHVEPAMDGQHDYWIEIGMSLHSWDATLGFELWRDWSMRGQGWDDRDGENAWKSFGNRAGFTIGTVVHLAQQGGWQPPKRERPAANGRADPADVGTPSPPTEPDEPRELSPKTIANYASAERSEMRELAEELAMPRYLRAGQEYADWRRLLHYCPQDVCLVGQDLYAICGQDGYWELTSQRHHTNLGLHLHEARQKALGDAYSFVQTETDDADTAARYRAALEFSYRDGIGYMRSLAEMGNIHIRAIVEGDPTITVGGDPDITVRHEPAAAFTLGPVLPFDDGTSVSLDRGALIGVAELRELLMLAPTWRIPRAYWQPDYLTQAPPEALPAKQFWRRLGWPILNRMAYHLRGTSKSVDCVMFRTADAGKSTAARLLKLATGGAIQHVESSAMLTSARTRFNTPEKLLSEHRVVIWDEVDKAGEIKAGVVNLLTGEDQQIETKGVDPHERHLIGTAVLIGADWPEIDVSVQGVKTRTHWCYSDVVEGVPAVEAWDGTDREAVLSEAGRTWTLTALINAAVAHGKNNTNATSEVTVRAQRVFHEEQTPDAAMLLAKLLVEDPKSWVSFFSIKRALKEAGAEDQLTNTALGRLLNECFPQSQSTRRTEDGRQVRGREGLRIVGESPEEEV